ncbi:MAG: glycosyltransferase [Thermodesulfobacteriota bacterium]|nr:glycosyltransferase [Thermodesulfobacteriota bacterium]
MKILYTKRRFRTGSAYKDLKNNIQSNFIFQGQDGFFLGSLLTAFHVTEKPFSYIEKHARKISNTYDWVIINYKASESGKGITKEQAQSFKNISGCRKALFIGSAQSKRIPGDRILDLFDLVFKREVYKDLDRYPISYANKQKLRTTMLACPLIPATRLNLNRIRIDKFGFENPPDEYLSDVFFTGANVNQMRSDVVNNLIDAPFVFRGGLQDSKKGVVENRRAFFKRLPHRKFIETIRKSRINLALEGRGALTFRHLELWCLCSFMISSPSLKDLNLPIPAIEGKHYVCFDNIEDLNDKVDFFLKNPDRRKNITKSGRDLFIKHYNFKRHGRYIKGCLEKL